MSDFTDDVLDGIFCESCGEFMGNAVGYPRKCSGCSRKAVVRIPKAKKKERDG